jgi:tetratricopeptide (TPR) repeat protein
VTVLLLYSQTAGFDFVNLDDHVYVYENPMVQDGLSREGVSWAITTYHTGNWHPLTWVSLMADVSIFGPGPAGPHITNMLLHAGSSVLLFLSLRSMTAAVWPSALAAALFALHPLRAESVAWVSERKDVLAAFFWMLTLLTYRWYAAGPTLPRYLLVVATFALGLSAKAMLVTLPLVLLLADAWPLRRYQQHWLAGPPAAPGFPPQTGLRLVLEKLPLLALAAVTSSFTVAAQRFGLALSDLDKIPLPWRIVNALDAYTVYLRKTVWPTELAVFYPHPALLRAELSASDLGRAAAAAAVLLLVSAAILRVVRRLPALGFGWLWYLGTLVPVVGLVQVGEQAYADRYTYIPSVGLYIIIAWALADLVARRPRIGPAVTTGTVVVLIALAGLTWFQIRTWRDGRALFTHAVAVTDDNYFALSNLGSLLRDDGRLEEAATYLERALAIRPDFTFGLVNYGIALDAQGKLDLAAAQHERALQLNPTLARARAHLGVIRYRQGRPAEAVQLLQEAVRFDPGSAFAQGNLGMVLLSLQRPADAIPHLQRALQVSPDTAATYNNLGVAYVRVQRYADAVAAFERALQLQPDYANARKGLEHAQRLLGAR